MTPRGARPLGEPRRREAEREQDRRFRDDRERYRAADDKGRVGHRLSHDFLLWLRARSISAPRASSSSSVHVSCLSSAVTVWPGEPPKKTRTRLRSAVRWAEARD